VGIVIVVASPDPSPPSDKPLSLIRQPYRAEAEAEDRKSAISQQPSAIDLAGVRLAKKLRH